MRLILLLGCLVLLPGHPVAAQSGVEIAVGAAYHRWIPPHPGTPDVYPSVPAVDVRVTRWGERWGVTGRFLAGIGSARVDPVTVRDRLTYIQVLARYRVDVGRSKLLLGFGGTVVGVRERLRLPDWHEDFYGWDGLYIYTGEALLSVPLASRLSIRGGVMAAWPHSIQLVILLAWRL